MTVISFSRARLTPQDVAAFNAVAKPRMEVGLWGSVTRQTETSSDRLVVRFPHLDRPVFHFERNRTGRYTLWFQDRQGWHSVGSG